MTIQNMRYIIEIARCKSISKAAKTLYMTQSALSNAVKETEEELGIQIFTRTNHGVILSYDGEDFITYCKEIVTKVDYVQERYQKRAAQHTSFSVSCQRLPFAVRAFRSLVSELDEKIYDLAFLELPFQEIFRAVSNGRSEIGIFLFRDIQVPEVRKSLYLHELNFTELAQPCVYVFLREAHPLANHGVLTEEDLKPYPFVTFDQRTDIGLNSEEIISFSNFEKYIHVNDRNTKLSLIRKSNAFSVGIELPTGANSEHGKKTAHSLLAIPLQLQDRIETVHVGYVLSKNRTVRKICLQYIEYLLQECRSL